MRRLNDDWWIGVNDTYATRTEGGVQVLWKGGRAIWTSIWSDDDRRSRPDRLDDLIVERAAGAIDLFREDEANLSRFGYLLEEIEGGGIQFGLYSWTVSENSVVRMACYYDLEEDLGWASAVTRSLAFGEPGSEPEVHDPLGESGYFVLAPEKLIGPDREPVLLAQRLTRASGQVSGWRFVGSEEDRPDASELHRASFFPLTLFLTNDPSLRAIINQGPGTSWWRASVTHPWRQVGNSRLSV